MSGDYSVHFVQNASRDFLHYLDCVVGTGLSKVSAGYFVLHS